MLGKQFELKIEKEKVRVQPHTHFLLLAHCRT